MHCARTEYNQENNKIGVKVSAFIGFDNEREKLQNTQFWMEVIIEGVFIVDETRFPIEKIHIWAEQNAPLILYPYVREAAFSLTSRVLKDSAALLPLLTVPTIKV